MPQASAMGIPMGQAPKYLPCEIIFALQKLLRISQGE